jgi:hypothetical protein
VNNGVVQAADRWDERVDKIVLLVAPYEDVHVLLMIAIKVVEHAFVRVQVLVIKVNVRVRIFKMCD